MPRSYSFDHFTAGKASPVRTPVRFDAGAYSEARPSKLDSEIHYGKQHAQTESIYHAREMAAQLEKLAGITPDNVQSLPPRAAKLPIGALPETPEPPERADETQSFGAVYDQAKQQLKALSHAATDARDALRQLSRMPWNVANMMLRRWTRLF